MTNPLIDAIAFKGVEGDKLALLKRLSQEVNKKSYKTPKKNCRHCYGRGHIGYMNGIKSMPVPCRCVFVKPVLGKKKA